MKLKSGSLNDPVYMAISHFSMLKGLNVVEKLTRPLFKHSLDVMDLMKGTEDRDGKFSSMLQCLKYLVRLHFLFFKQHKPR